MEVEMAVLGRPGMAVLGPSRPSPCGLCGPKANLKSNISSLVRIQELCESRGGRPGLPVPNSPYGGCGRPGLLVSP